MVVVVVVPIRRGNSSSYTLRNMDTPLPMEAVDLALPLASSSRRNRTRHSHHLRALTRSSLHIITVKMVTGMEEESVRLADNYSSMRAAALLTMLSKESDYNSTNSICS